MWQVCVCVRHIEPCDWLTHFMSVISLCLSSVNRFCSADKDTEKCVKVAYISVHACNSSKELDDHENEIVDRDKDKMFKNVFDGFKNWQMVNTTSIFWYGIKIETFLQIISLKSKKEQMLFIENDR